ncbi:MAG: type I glyceraldehyde-3-phosphate dehydrogenase [Chloroflexi bacterium]|nr:type I glyceraldehyde-3-phosphate dehydrogenase [Chloroflexota bacterium]
MAFRVGINGFGRIGRLALRLLLEHAPAVEVVAINDRGDAEINGYLFQYDSNYGPFPGHIATRADMLVVNDRPIRLFSKPSPAEIPWRACGVDLVIESTGVFADAKAARAHLDAGATRVLVTAPSKNADATLVAGVNENQFDRARHCVVSAASCTTNCLAPVAKILHDAFGIAHGTMATIHAYTNDQRILDKSHKDPRRSRAGAANIIPTTTGATKALGLVLPDLAGKIGGIAYRVPTLTVSVLDLTVALQRPATPRAVNEAFAAASANGMRGILAYCAAPLVSADFKGNPHSSIIDGLSTQFVEGSALTRVVAWYDNEWGYAARIADLTRFIADGTRAWQEVNQ